MGLASGPGPRPADLAMRGPGSGREFVTGVRPRSPGGMGPGAGERVVGAAWQRPRWGGVALLCLGLALAVLGGLAWAAKDDLERW